MKLTVLQFKIVKTPDHEALEILFHEFKLDNFKINFQYKKLRKYFFLKYA